jgi:hypothetical protein
MAVVVANSGANKLRPVSAVASLTFVAWLTVWLLCWYCGCVGRCWVVAGVWAASAGARRDRAAGDGRWGGALGRRGDR